MTLNIALTHDLDLGFCDFELCPHPWHWPLIVKVNFWNTCVSGTEGTINMERKGYESIRCYAYYVTMSYDFDLRFWWSICLKKELYHRNKRVDWHWTNSMWVNRMLDPSCDISKTHILDMGRSIDLELKICELDTMSDAYWAYSRATVHGKYIGPAMGRCETVAVSNVLTHECAVRLLN